MFGIPFGLLLLTTVAEPVVKAVLAAVIIAFSAYCLAGRSRFELRDDRLAWVFGFGAGVLGGAYGMNGPPLVAYGRCGAGPPSGSGPPCRGTSCPPAWSAWSATGRPGSGSPP